MDITRACRDKYKLQSLAQKAYELFIAECERQGLKILITETLRPKERQYYLACQGRTISQAKSMGVPSSYAEKYANPNAKQVTWTLSSKHLDGWAFDFCQNINGKEYEDSFMKKGGKIVSELGLEWGGSFGDSPHVQVPKNWKPPVDKDDPYLKAVDKMVEKGVISSPDVWKKEAYTKENVKSLIIKISSKL